ncbi:hypothetical protein T4C_4128 [Trichinella pseudospiralis]|uniref:Uncharacterized protein n=1 Tax=Trichinella pseudospiralis TaxID=6337 RepID=A0A0V1GBM4_TRIPS|nr:hypothetical protein T4C_4128 [Trichinella pseudospiralis]
MFCIVLKQKINCFWSRMKAIFIGQRHEAMIDHKECIIQFIFLK